MKKILILVCIFNLASPLGILSDAKANSADAILEALRSANVARSEEASERQSWELEREKQMLLQRALADKISRLNQDIKRLKATIATLKATLPQPSAGTDNEVDGLLKTAAETLYTSLEELDKNWLPGVVPALNDLPNNADEAFAMALKALNETERRATQVQVEIITAELDGKSQAITLLRVGAVAGWWISMDGTRAGTATKYKGALSLSQRTTPEAIQAIGLAIRIARGRSAPVLVSLPAEHLTIDTVEVKP